jgi:hypothetical protein
MEGSAFDETSFFRAIQDSGVRALLIGRRALIALGLPVNTYGYDLWIHRDDAAALNAALLPLELAPNRTPEEARRVGRYVLEADDRVDVLVARGVQTVDGAMVWFDDLWPRRVELDLGEGVHVAVPALDDLILTKRFGARPRDAEDIRLLQLLKARTP